jgi:hypothetical protein
VKHRTKAQAETEAVKALTRAVPQAAEAAVLPTVLLRVIVHKAGQVTVPKANLAAEEVAPVLTEAKAEVVRGNIFHSLKN